MDDEKSDLLEVLELVLGLHSEKSPRGDFNGLLTEPILEPDELEIAFLTGGHPAPLRKKLEEEIAAHVREQKAARLLALADHYSVTVGSEHWAEQLVCCLAEQFVPGFRVQCVTERHNKRGVAKTGRPRHVVRPGPLNSREKTVDTDLVREVAQLCASGRQVLSACRLLSTRRDSPWHLKGPRALAASYSRAREAIARSLKEYDDDPLLNRLQTMIDQHQSR